MIKDDILRMAREAGFRTGSYALSNGDECVFAHPVAFSDCIPELERFAALVAAEVGIAQWHRGYAEGQSVERAACAQIAEMEPCMTHTPHRIAAAIRARGIHDSAARHA